MPVAPARELTGEAYSKSTDLTIGIEEEFQILDPISLALTPGYDALLEAAAPVSRHELKPEVITSEVEIATGKCRDLVQAQDELVAKRGLLARAAERAHLLLCGTGTHPFSPWQEQRIGNNPYYKALNEELGYVLWRNNTFSFHVHVGVHGRERAIAVCDGLRVYLPHLLALSASSPFGEGVLTKLHSTRTQWFAKAMPRSGIPDLFASWEAFRQYLNFLYESESIRSFKQLWWNVRPHVVHGTVEVRVCDAQPRVENTVAISALVIALVCQLLQDIDTGKDPLVIPHRYIEENAWRAVRYGLTGNLIDLQTGLQQPARDAIGWMLDNLAPLAAQLHLGQYWNALNHILETGNSAMEQASAFKQGLNLPEIHRETARQSVTLPVPATI